jgi:hypothetical protein
VPNAARKVDHARTSEAAAILRELNQAQASLDECFVELDRVLAQPRLDAGALTSVRLKLAGIRLTRGPLITRVADFLASRVTRAEEAMLEELKASHHRILATATAHTAKWTLQAIAADWDTYRRETRDLVRQWALKAMRDERLVHPLVQRCGEMSS